jgi:hypothetical protein
MLEAGGNNGRDANGQFTKGNPGGPGRPRRSVERDYLATLSEAVTLNDWAQICKSAVEKAGSSFFNMTRFLGISAKK